MKVLSRQVVLDELRELCRGRFRTIREQAEFFGGDVRQLRGKARWTMGHNPLSWERMIIWLGRLGYEIRFEIVKKEPSNGAARDRRAQPVGADDQADRPQASG